MLSEPSRALHMNLQTEHEVNFFPKHFFGTRWTFFRNCTRTFFLNEVNLFMNEVNFFLTEWTFFLNFFLGMGLSELSRQWYVNLLAHDMWTFRRNMKWTFFLNIFLERSELFFTTSHELFFCTKWTIFMNEVNFWKLSSEP